MKKIILAGLIAASPSLVLAHGDHAPKVAKCAAKDCTKTEIEAAAPIAVELLSKSGKIESSWTVAKIEKIEQKQFAKAKEWVVTLLDSTKTDKSKQNLYVFITNKGYLNGANYTGE